MTPKPPAAPAGYAAWLADLKARIRETRLRAALAVNDLLASVIGDHPDRFRGFAALPLQDRAAPADELERAVTQLGLVGGLVNAHTNGEYLDDPDFSVVWERAAGLGVPLDLHPANGVDTAHVLSGHPELVGPMWSWGIDTSTHALRPGWPAVSRRPRGSAAARHARPTMPLARVSGTKRGGRVVRSEERRNWSGRTNFGRA